MVSAQRNRGASVVAFTPTTQTMLLLLPRTKKHSTDGDTPISMYLFRRASCFIHSTYNSFHKINLFSLQLKIK